MGLLKKDDAIVLPDTIVLFETETGKCPVYIKDVVRDTLARNQVGWIVTMSVLLPNIDEFPEIEIRVNDDHLMGEPFTVAGKPQRFIAIDLSAKKRDSVGTQSKKAPFLRGIQGGKK